MVRRSHSPHIVMVHEDRDIAVIHKPVGLLAVPIRGSSASNARDILASHLAAGGQRALVIHRIDRYTSGLMVFAKNRGAREHLVRQFLSHTPLRIYLALIRGHPDSEEGDLHHYLKQTLRGFRQVVVRGEREGGTLAMAHYRVLERMDRASLVEVRLVTGLKNQIRVQFAALGMPVVGDRHYAASEKAIEETDHPALHAHRLGFLHPRTEKYVEFKADPPGDLLRLLALFRGSGEGVARKNHGTPASAVPGKSKGQRAPMAGFRRRRRGER
jgi:23S rRNA pseudouridine1911/1915/1917 synthase